MAGAGVDLFSWVGFSKTARAKENVAGRSVAFSVQFVFVFVSEIFRLGRVLRLYSVGSSVCYCLVLDWLVILYL